MRECLTDTDRVHHIVHDHLHMLCGMITQLIIKLLRISHKCGHFMSHFYPLYQHSLPCIPRRSKNNNFHCSFLLFTGPQYLVN
ncbi:hypothetical protein D3C73_1527200 [compost metagenome]